jgi:hypothetical protein
MTSTADVTVAQFLQEKAANFRRFLEDNSPDEELKKQMTMYQPALLLPTISTFLLPMAAGGLLPQAVNEILSHLSPSDVDATRSKITRYLEMFVSVVQDNASLQQKN